MRTIKAILIDPYAMTVTEVEHDADDYHNIYSLLSGEPHDVRCFTCVHLDDGDAIFVDDEGLMTNQPREFFVWEGYHQPLAGRGLILGSDSRGETQRCKTTLDEARAKVDFGQPVRVNGRIAWVSAGGVSA